MNRNTKIGLRAIATYILVALFVLIVTSPARAQTFPGYPQALEGRSGWQQAARDEYFFLPSVEAVNGQILTWAKAPGDRGEWIYVYMALDCYAWNYVLVSVYVPQAQRVVDVIGQPGVPGVTTPAPGTVRYRFMQTMCMQALGIPPPLAAVPYNPAGEVAR